MADHDELGREGEVIARNYLKDNGYKIIATNWRLGHNEIDIVAEHENCLVVVEVKTRSNSYPEDPLLLINRQKQKHLIRAANCYIRKYDIELETRFDVIFIRIASGKSSIEHIRDAFYPTIR